MTDLKLTVVGSADAFNALGRFHSCYWLDSDREGAAIMVDFGATALAALRRVRRRPSELAGVVLTHLHGDHIGGLPFLLLDGMYKEPRQEPLRIVGPTGTAQRLNQLFRVTYGSLADEPLPFELDIEEIAPGERARLAGYEITGFAAEHMDPPEQPLCLRVVRDDKQVAFSGDTAICDGLRDAAHGVDLLVAECTGLAPPIGRHISWQEWRELLPELTCNRVLLSHLSQGVRERIGELSASAPAGPELSFADDGMQVQI